jgi:hypothetical protein
VDVAKQSTSPDGTTSGTTPKQRKSHHPHQHHNKGDLRLVIDMGMVYSLGTQIQVQRVLVVPGTDTPFGTRGCTRTHIRQT